jgi:hypothetical protein
MANYTVKVPDGSTHVIAGPDGASDDEVIAQAQKLFPQKQSFGQTAKRSVIDMFRRPAMAAKDLGTNPVTMANSIPPLASTAGGLSPIPGGATMGMAGGQAVRDLALKALKKPIPGGWQHAGELGGAALSDIIAIPSMKKSYYGGKVGEAEAAAHVPPPQDIPSIPMATGQKSAGDFINEAVDSVKSSGGSGSPTYWKQIKDQVDRIYDMGVDQKLTTLDKGRLRWLNQQVQAGLNAAVPGREIPAAALARSQTIPNAMNRVWRQIPAKYKVAGVAGGAVGIPLSAAEILKKLLGGP